MNKKKSPSLANRIPSKVWLLISFLVAMVLWYVISLLPATARAFPNAIVTFSSLATMIERGVFFTDLASSMISVFSGYFLAFIIALPVAILMAWYLPVRNIIEPWIQFVRNIPPLAYVPLIVACAGVGRKPQIITITIACFLIMSIRASSTWTRPSSKRPGFWAQAIRISSSGSSPPPPCPSF